MGDIRTDPLDPLWRELLEGDGKCPFVVPDAAAKHVELLHYSGGRQATYVAIGHHPTSNENPADGPCIKVMFAPFVEGTAIIYNVTEMALQGKARPFFCKLEHGGHRLYAMLPYQIEAIKLTATLVKGKLQFDVSFADAGGDVIQAVMPFEMRYVDQRSETRLKEIRVTNREGQHVDSYDYRWSVSPGRWTAVVRSLLTGQEQSANFEPPM